MFSEKNAKKLLAERSAMGVPTIAALEAAVGGLSKPSKVPWFGYSLPASACKTGSKLRLIEGSVCSKCYAHKGRYVFPAVQAAMHRRLAALANLEWWAANMVMLLARRANGAEAWFRWHDSGDVQSQSHLLAIIWIAKQLPHIRFWLPTKERTFLPDIGLVPENLTIRVSAAMLGVTLCSTWPTSSVGSGDEFVCPAKHQDGKCGDCRACWYTKVTNVDYPLH